MILEIAKYGHPVLREKGARIKQVTPELRQLAANMIETMYAANGLGLAAQQIGRALMLTVIDVSGTDRPSELFIDGQPQDIAGFMPLVLINPQISNPTGDETGSEGCLSVPDISAEIRRAAKISVRAQNLDGKGLTFDCTGLLARAVQHEVDHLNGILFIERMDAATRASFSGKLKKLQKETLSQHPKKRQAAARASQTVDRFYESAHLTMNFLRTVIALCSSFKSYRQVRDLAVSTSLKHLIKLVSVLSVVLLISFIPWIFTFSDTFAQWADQHFPPFSIHDGRITTSAPQPFYAGEGDFLFVLDTTGQVTKPDPKALQGILFTADSFLVWMKATNATDAAIQSQRHSLRGFPDGVVNGNYLRKLIRTFLWVGLPLALVVLILLSLLSTLLQAYLFSFIASFMERSIPAPLQLQQLLNIAIHAVTPAAIIVTAYSAMRLHDLNLWVIYLVAYGVTLVGATNACRDQSRPPVAEA